MTVTGNGKNVVVFRYLREASSLHDGGIGFVEVKRVWGGREVQALKVVVFSCRLLRCPFEGECLFIVDAMDGDWGYFIPVSPL